MTILQRTVKELGYKRLPGCNRYNGSAYLLDTNTDSSWQLLLYCSFLIVPARYSFCMRLQKYGQCKGKIVNIVFLDLISVILKLLQMNKITGPCVILIRNPLLILNTHDYFLTTVCLCYKLIR